MRNIAILGSTGSVGNQVMEVLRKKKGYYRIFGLAAYNEVDKIYFQIKEFKPEIVSMGERKAKEELKKRLRDKKKPVLYQGKEGLLKISTHPKLDTLVVATSGVCALLPILKAIRKRKKIIIANKESLIVGGEIIKKYWKKYKAGILPIDSEHSAIFQCLIGENKKEVKNLILTCSGGPFRNYPKKKLEGVTINEVLSHPIWKMGPKITVDSATLMNKGFEVLEAHYLFDIPLEKIKVIIHPECICHSMVEFIDGTIKAQLSVPDMQLPIQYALFYPQRLASFLPTLDLSSIKKLSFLKPNTKLFPCLDLALTAGKIGGTMPAALVFADEIAVKMFLENKIKFLDIPKIIRKIIKTHQSISNPSLKEILMVENWVQKQLI